MMFDECLVFMFSSLHLIDELARLLVFVDFQGYIICIYALYINNSVDLLLAVGSWHKGKMLYAVHC